MVIAVPSLDAGDAPIARSASAAPPTSSARRSSKDGSHPGRRLKEGELAHRAGYQPDADPRGVLRPAGRGPRRVDTEPGRCRSLLRARRAAGHVRPARRARRARGAPRRVASATEQIEELRESCGRFEMLQPRARCAEVVAENLVFHETIHDAAASGRLTGMVRQTIELPLVYRSYVWYSPEQRRISPLPPAARRGARAPRPERAERIMKEHIFEARDTARRALARAEARHDGGGAATRTRVTGAAGPGPLEGVRVDRARAAPRRAVHRPAARRHGRRDHQGRAAGQAGSDARVGQGALRGALALVAGAVAQQEVRHARPARRSAGRSCCSASSSRRDVLVENFRPGTLERWNIGLERLCEVEPAARARARLRLRADRARTRSGPASPPSPRPWAGSATSTAFPASRRRACTSRSATRSPACSPCRASSPRSTGATRSAAGAGRSSTCR